MLVQLSNLIFRTKTLFSKQQTYRQNIFIVSDSFYETIRYGMGLCKLSIGTMNLLPKF